MVKSGSGQQPSGKIIPAGARHAGVAGKLGVSNVRPAGSIRCGFDGPMVAPWRKSVSIFKQPVTLVNTTHKDTKPTPENIGQSVSVRQRKQEKPKQVFWSNRLSGLRAMRATSDFYLPPAETPEEDDDEDVAGEHKVAHKKGELTKKEKQHAGVMESTDEESLTLPQRIIPLGNCDTMCTIASIAACLSSTNVQPITGQMESKRNIDTNLGAFVNADQPLMQAVAISDQDIAAQEKRVLDARRRLEETLKHFG